MRKAPGEHPLLLYRRFIAVFLCGRLSTGTHDGGEDEYAFGGKPFKGHIKSSAFHFGNTEPNVEELFNRRVCFWRSELPRRHVLKTLKYSRKVWPQVVKQRNPEQRTAKVGSDVCFHRAKVFRATKGSIIKAFCYAPWHQGWRKSTRRWRETLGCRS